MTIIEQPEHISTEDLSELMEVWESSVKATHNFLSSEDFEFYKDLIPSFFDKITLHYIKDANNKILGFMGTKDCFLEMLFVREEYRGRGIGKSLLCYALTNLDVNKVDVNQQNDHARIFYFRHGFRMKRFSRVDGFGKPYPIGIWNYRINKFENKLGIISIKCTTLRLNEGIHVTHYYYAA